MRNLMNEIDTYEDEDYMSIERFGRKAGFKGEGAKRERKGDSVRRKRQQKEREREQLVKDSEDGNW